MKGKRTSFAGESCPIARTLGLIGDPWSLLIIRDALRGSQRFGEFQKGLGVAKNLLAERLRRLVAEGLLEIRDAPEGGTRKVYLLTDKGKRLKPALLALHEWGSAFVPRLEPSLHTEATTEKGLQQVDANST